LRILFVVLCMASAAAARAANPIQIENAKPGSADWTMFSESVAGEIEGYASAASVNQGESISFYVNTTAPTYDLDIFRMGWYGGKGARRVHPSVRRTGVAQVIPSPDPVTGLIECNWTDPYTITIPNDWVSGAYLVKLTTVGAPAVKSRYIFFVVREDSRTANHNFQLAVTTAQAYNNWGGKSLYSNYSIGGAARKVSFDRPYADGSGTGIFLWRWEYAAVRFLEREGYDLVYTTNIDTHRRGQVLLNAKSFLSIGHDEYWSWEMRENVEDALDAGVNLGIFSANTCYWQVRFEPSAITGAPDRTMVGYKEAALQSDPYALDGNPANDHLVTGLWREAPVNRPEAALLGVQYISDPVDADIVIDDVTSAPWVFAETGLAKGSKLPGLLGYEVDAINEHTPPGTIRLGHSPFIDHDSGNTLYSDMTVYAKGGAWVFATGSIQWAWGLDNWNASNRGTRLSPAAQQITRNVLRKFAGSTAHLDCQVTLEPPSAVAGVAAGSGSVTLTTASNCTWAVASNAPWLTVTSSANGAGSSTISYQYTSNAGNPERIGTITAGEATFTLQQESGCSYAISPQSASVGAAGGNVVFSITTTPACSWSVILPPSWLTLASPASGTGSGSITLTAAANGGPSRDAGVYINGTYYNVHQASGCTYFTQPTSVAMPASGGEGVITISTSNDCSWSSSSGSSWIVLNSGLSGQGNGTTAYTVLPNNTGSARTGTMVVAGNIVSVRQSADNCVYEFSPLWASYTAAAATGTVTVTSGCAWEAFVESGSAFLTITSTTPTTLTYSVAQNTIGHGRSGTIRIAGRAINITQNGASVPIFSLTATATSTNTSSLTWAAVSGATMYEVYRSFNGSSLSLVTSTPSTSFGDTGLSSNRTYLYRIRAIGGSDVLGFSNLDPATTVMFTDPTIIPRSTRIKAAHIIELRTAVNAMRTAGQLPSMLFTDTTLVRRKIKDEHVAELRAALAAARAAIGLPPVSYSVPSLVRVKASHITELRAGVQ
jgi:Viral BACON domain/Putative binding domain, N-terminal